MRNGTETFGPSSEKIERFFEELKSYRWFEKVGGAPLPPGEAIARVDFHFMAKEGGFEYRGWGNLLARHESLAERHVFANALLGQQDALNSVLRIENIAASAVDDLLIRLDDQFGTDNFYYEGTWSFPHELAELPDRLIRGAGLELLVSDIDSSLGFFQSLLPWFQRGYWPAGWQGEYPKGSLLLW